jgi:hypothetical protein
MNTHDDGGDGLLYCKSRALDAAASTLTRRFQSLREEQEQEQKQEEELQKLGKTQNQNIRRGEEATLQTHSAAAAAAVATHAATDMRSRARHALSPPPPFVRHAEACAHLSARGVGWDKATEVLLAEDAAAVAAFVGAEVAAVVDSARELESSARGHPRQDNADVERWWGAADDLALRAEAGLSTSRIQLTHP